MNKKPKLNEGLYDQGIFKAIFLAGGPGSGKSYVASNTIEGMGLKVVNIDDFLPMLLKQKGIPLNFQNLTPEQEKEMLAAREKSREYVGKRLDLWLQGRLGLVVDGTGRNYEKLIKTAEKFKALGYETYMIFVNTSLEIAQERNIKRGEYGDRVLDKKVVKQLWYDAQSNMARYKKYFNNNFIVVNNNDYNNSELLNVVHKKIRNFVTTPSQNISAQKWVEKEKKQHMRIDEIRKLIREELNKKNLLPNKNLI